MTARTPLHTPAPTMSSDSLFTDVSRYSDEMTRSAPTSSSQNILNYPHSHDEASTEGIYKKRAQSDTSFLPASPTSSNFDTLQLSSSPSNVRDPIRDTDENPTIVLRPSLNNSIHQLSTLSHSNHTLSPYTRPLEHFTVRSVPPRIAGAGLSLGGIERQPAKARRKRTYRLGGARKTLLLSKTPIPEVLDVLASPPSPIPLPSEFDASDMDRYFRTQDDFNPHSPELHPTHDTLRQPSTAS